MNDCSFAEQRRFASRLVAGSEEAFAQLIEQHKDRLVNYLTRLSGDREVAEDLAQETFLRFFQSRSRYREEGKLSAYLFRIAGNLLRTRERQRRRRKLLQSIFLRGSEHLIEQPSQGRETARRELRDELQRALAQLPMEFRVPVVLAEVEGWSYREIAELLDCREGTVKSRIFRGKERLRAALAPARRESKGTNR